MEMYNEIHDIKMSLARIETSISGDKNNGVKGLAERTKDLEDYRQKDERLKWKITGGIFASVPILGFVWECLKEWYQKNF